MEERLYLISMIDDASSRLFARFVRQRFDRREHAALEGTWSITAGRGVLHGQGELIQSIRERRRDEQAIRTR